MQKLLQLIAVVLLLTGYGTARAGDPVYPFSAIPDSMKKDVHLVKRLEEITQTIAGPQEVNLVTRYVFTVLDEKGAGYTTLIRSYNKLAEVRSISGALYDEQGKLIKRLKQSEIRDLSVDGDGSLMTDTRYKVHRFYHNIFPYTVEYEVEERKKTAYNLQSWTTQSKMFTVEQARFTVITPADYNLRYSSYCYPGKPVVSEQKGWKTHVWEVRNLSAFKEEPYSRERYQLSPSIMIAPAGFKYDDYEGNASSWEGLGKFAYALNAGRDQLPDNMKQKVHQLTDGLATREDKISTLYAYLQQNYRYISIQLGIGGFQTFDAKTVAAKGYGDCKALSNYMMAMLGEAGIKSYCAWVNAGEGETDLDENFPDDPFNHVILCVPGAKDTTWLECTSNTLPAGYLGSFTCNRAVLLITEAGGKLVHTPAYNLAQNQQHRTVNASLDESGDLKLSAVTSSTGQEQENLHDMLHQLSKEKQLEAMRKELDLSSYDVVRYECKETKSINPAVEEQMELNCHAYATATGKRIFITPNILGRDTRKLDPDEDRISDIVLKYEFQRTDTINITVPAGYKAEVLPAPVVLTAKFGTYNVSVSMKDNTVNYIRRMERRAGTFPAKDYPELAKFFSTIYKADRNRVVLVKE